MLPFTLPLLIPSLLMWSETAARASEEWSILPPQSSQSLERPLRHKILSDLVQLAQVPDPKESRGSPKLSSEKPVLQAAPPSKTPVAGKPTQEKNKDPKVPDPSPDSQPLSPDERVENVIHYLRLVPAGEAEGSTKELKSFTALLLKDGRVFENEEKAPDIFDPTLRPAGSAGTGRWQRDGEAYALMFSDGTEGTAVSSAALTLPAPTAMVLRGEYKVTSEEESVTFSPRIIFFKDGSLLLKMDESTTSSGRYKIHQRSIEIEDGLGSRTALLFGVHEPTENPRFLIIGNKLYQKVDDE